MKKRILKFIKELFDKSYVKFISYILIAVIIFSFYGIFDGDNINLLLILKKIFSIVTSEDTLSVILAAMVSICFAKFLKNCDKYLEESYKLSDDHHSIIDKYNGHPKERLSSKVNIVDKVGSYMSLNHINSSANKKLKPHVKDTYSNEYKNLSKTIERFKNGILFLPTINVFANVEGNTNLIFNDSREVFPMTDFIIDNASILLSAHKNSAKTNTGTVRLTDFDYEASSNTLTLDTQRSTYFHMLMTNRCMDFEVYDGVSVRSAYEYNNFISTLSESKLSNQIGINGLVLSNDGYVLIEKRDHRKTTWKNKFAQSISLALKTRDLKIGNNILAPTYDEANKKLSGVIYKSLKSNFGLKESDFEGFELKENFLGIARDLLEGGKPNLYFYIVTNFSAKELCARLKKSASDTGEGALNTTKLTSDYYIVPFDDLKFDFNYALKLNRRKCYWPRRHVYPRCNMFRSAVSAVRHALLRCLKPTFVRECGEALLVTVSYLELCRDRISSLSKK